MGANLQTYDLEIPDLSGVAGFNNAWGLVSGQPTQYVLTVYSGLAGLTALTDATTFRFSSRTGTVNF